MSLCENDPTLLVQNGEVHEIGILPAEDLKDVVVKEPAFLDQTEAFVDEIIDDRDGEGLAEHPALLFHLCVEDALFPLHGKVAHGTHHEHDGDGGDEYEFELEERPFI